LLSVKTEENCGAFLQFDVHMRTLNCNCGFLQDLQGPRKVNLENAC